MSPNPQTCQRGSMLVMAIFVIVVISVLAMAMMRMLSSSSTSIVYEVYGVRALNAARSGLEFSLRDAFPLDDGTPVCLDDSSDWQDISGVTGLENCSYLARCTSWEEDEVTYYRFKSTGQCRINDERLVSRTIEVDGAL